jgi:hypothetical protein
VIVTEDINRAVRANTGKAWVKITNPKERVLMYSFGVFLLLMFTVRNVNYITLGIWLFWLALGLLLRNAIKQSFDEWGLKGVAGLTGIVVAGVAMGYMQPVLIQMSVADDVLEIYNEINVKNIGATFMLIYGTMIMPAKMMQSMAKDAYSILRYGHRASKKIKKPSLHKKKDGL